MLNEIAARIETEADDDDAVILRAVFAMFCKVPVNELVQPLSWLTDRWADLAGDALGWRVVGATATRFARAGRDTRERIRRELGAAAADRITSFLWQGPDPYAPEFRLKALVRDHVENPEKPWTALVELVFPIPDDPGGWDRLVQESDAISARFPFDTAYLSPGLLCGDEALKREAGELIGPLAMRHPGLDVANNTTTCYFLGRRTRGARWITYLSGDIAAGVELSPLEAMEGVETRETEGAVRIQASERPEIGDTNRRIDTPGLRAVAAALEPITFFGDHNLALLLRDDQEMRARWERRFLAE